MPEPDELRERELRIDEGARSLVHEIQDRHRTAATAMEEARRQAEADIQRVTGVDWATTNQRNEPYVPLPSLTRPSEQDREAALIKAEKLLREALPEELYISLCALGYFVIQGLNRGGWANSYKISKSEKTKVTTENGSIHSACIEFAPNFVPQAPPPADRVVMEYLLIKSDEPRYLETANLSLIEGPRGEVHDGYAAELHRQREYLQPARMDMARRVRYQPRVGDTINVRYPEYITMNPRPVGRTQAHILSAMASQIARMLATDELFRGIRFPLRPAGEWQCLPGMRLYLTGVQREATSTEPHDGRLLGWICDEIVTELIHRIPPRLLSIEGMFELTPVEFDHHFRVVGSSVQRECDRGLSIRLTHLINRDNNTSIYCAEMGLVLRDE